MLSSRTFVLRPLAAWVCCTLAGLAPALAEDAPGSAASPPAWTAKVESRLNLDPKQESAFRAYVSALPNPSSQPAWLGADQFRAMTMPQRLDYLAEHIALALATARAQAEAVHRFYALLSVEQRKVFDEETRPPKGRPGVAADALSQPAPDLPDYNLPSHTEPDWLIKPRPEDLTRVYPTQAARDHVDGRVVLSCVADEDGYLADCVVSSETPTDRGFGNAALELTGYMRMSPATLYGVPTRSDVNVPVHFAMGE